MQTDNNLYTSSNQRLSSLLIYLFICMLYAALFFYVAYFFYTGAEKIHAYFTSWITAANDQLTFCFR